MFQWKTVRVFISSTFRDMHAERDHLVRFVFPRLREELLKHRIYLIDVDLRWGVTSDQDALGVCREIIDECHPRFIGMLGGRYGWVPKGQDESITADEIHYGVLNREAEERGNAFLYFRDTNSTAEIIEETPGDHREIEGSDAAIKLTALKQTITDAGLPVFIYPAQWDPTQKRLIGLEVFGNRVFGDLLQSFMDDTELAERFSFDETTTPDEFQEEADQMEAFIEERTERYVIGSREPLLKEMTAFANAEGNPNIFVLTGEPGSGKSAFLAKLTRDLFSLYPSCFILSHFVGASSGSTDLRRTLRRLCHALARAAGSTESLPLDIKDLITHFQKRLTETASKQRVILVFDALNQFDSTDGAHYMHWLPRELPPGLRIIASTLEHPVLHVMEARGDSVRIVKLDPFTKEDALAIIQGYLQRYAKRFSQVQLDSLLSKPGCHLPLYLLTALEELRTLGTYEEITTRIRELPGEALSLFGWILTERLANDPGFRDREGRLCGAVLVEQFAACLGVSRRGLSPAELTALLDPGDPLGNVAALLRLLRPYLMRRGELLDFYHGQFREAADAAHLDTTEKHRSAHRAVGTCLQSLVDPDGDGKCRCPSPHALSELPYHQTRAEAWPALVGTLENLFFLEAKVSHGMAFDLAQDYTTAVNSLSEDHTERQRLRLLDDALRRELDAVVRYPDAAVQLLFGRLWSERAWREPFLEHATAQGTWLFEKHTTQTSSAWEERVFGAHVSGFALLDSLDAMVVSIGVGVTSELRRVSLREKDRDDRVIVTMPDEVTPDCLIAPRGGGPLVIADRLRGCVFELDRVTDTLTGPTCLNAPLSHLAEVIQPSGTLAATYLRGDVSVFPMKGGTANVISPANAWSYEAVLDTQKGDDGSHTWLLASYDYEPDWLLVRLDGAEDGPTCHEILRWPSGMRAWAVDKMHDRLAVATVNGLVEIYTFRDGLRLLELSDPGPITSVALAPDGDYLVVGDADGRISWSALSSPRWSSFPAHETGVADVAIFREGSTLNVISRSKRGELKVWGVPLTAATSETTATISEEGGKREPALSGVFAPDGSVLFFAGTKHIRAVSSDRDEAIWESELGDLRGSARLRWFTPRILIGTTPDGRLTGWDTEDGRRLWTVQTRGSLLAAFDWATDTQMLVASSYNRQLFLGSPAEGDLRPILNSEHQIRHVRFGGNGRWLILYEAGQPVTGGFASQFVFRLHVLEVSDKGDVTALDQMATCDTGMQGPPPFAIRGNELWHLSAKGAILKMAIDQGKREPNLGQMLNGEYRLLVLDRSGFLVLADKKGAVWSCTPDLSKCRALLPPGKDPMNLITNLEQGMVVIVRDLGLEWWDISNPDKPVRRATVPTRQFILHTQVTTGLQQTLVHEFGGLPYWLRHVLRDGSPPTVSCTNFVFRLEDYHVNV